MKRIILCVLIIFMLCIMIFPIPLFADDTSTPKNPEEMLSPDELGYVTAIRGLDVAVRLQIATCKEQLANANPIDIDWTNSFTGSITALIGLMGQFSLPAPDTFSSIHEALAIFTMPPIGWQNEEIFNASGASEGKRDFLKVAQEISGFSGFFNSAEGLMNVVEGKMDAKIAALAKERAAAYNFYGGFFSCKEAT